MGHPDYKHWVFANSVKLLEAHQPTAITCEFDNVCRLLRQKTVEMLFENGETMLSELEVGAES